MNIIVFKFGHTFGIFDPPTKYKHEFEHTTNEIFPSSRRDRDVNRQRYERIVLDSSTADYRPFLTEQVASSELRVGDIVMLHKGQRVPADMILLRTNETMGTVFIRTDQLDGEIDWKLRFVFCHLLLRGGLFCLGKYYQNILLLVMDCNPLLLDTVLSAPGVLYFQFDSNILFPKIIFNKKR